MESGWRNLSDSSCGGGDGSGGQNGLFTNSAWDNWDIGTTAATRYDWSNHEVCGDIPAATAAARGSEASVVHALLLGVASNDVNRHLDAGVGSTHQRIPDPHMMCLKLGKRHYCEDAVVPHRHMAVESSSTKRGKPPYPYYITDAITTPPTTTATTVRPPSPAVTIPSSPAAVPRCQVEGCHVALSNAKEYYRRHKVCEIHSKAPKVVVLGLQQRFCQQCSRFHGVTEFDETKRSCRRRLEGHNQRRRKGSLSHHHENNLMVKGRFRSIAVLPPSPPLPSKPGCALSLLSSPKIEPQISSDDLSSRRSAALWELIAENRATTIFGQFWDQNSSQQPISENAIDMLPNAQMRNRLNGVDHTTMALDLMQSSTSDFGFLSMKEKSKDPEECPDYCWSAFGGTNVV